MADVIANFASALIDDDEVDHCEVVEMLDGVLEYGAYLRLCDHLEVCNIHHCDINICMDLWDEMRPLCEAAREAMNRDEDD